MPCAGSNKSQKYAIHIYIPPLKKLIVDVSAFPQYVFMFVHDTQKLYILLEQAILSGTLCYKSGDTPPRKRQVIKPHVNGESLFSTGDMNIDVVANSTISTQHHAWIE